MNTQRNMIDNVIQRTIEDFFCTLAPLFPHAKTGDFPPWAEDQLSGALLSAAQFWLEWNDPTQALSEKARQALEGGLEVLREVWLGPTIVQKDQMLPLAHNMVKNMEVVSARAFYEDLYGDGDDYEPWQLVVKFSLDEYGAKSYFWIDFNGSAEAMAESRQWSVDVCNLSLAANDANAVFVHVLKYAHENI